MKLEKLGDLFEITSGGTPLTSEAKYYDGGTIPWVRTGDLKIHELKEVPGRITEYGLKNSSAKIFPPNTVLIALYGATIGNCSVLKIPAATNQACAALLPNNLVDADYLYFYLQRIKPNLIQKGIGGGQPNISGKILKETKIPLPETLPDQIRIATLLSRAEALIQKRRESLRLLDELVKGVFLEMFGNPAFNPKKFPIEKLSKFYINPKEGTKCGPFGSALKKHEYQPFGIAVWVMDNINEKGEFIENGCLWITPEKFKQLEGYNAKSGDIIISRAGTVGKMCVIKTDHEKSIISSNLIRLRLNSSKLLPFYFVTLMTHFRDRVGRLKKGDEGAFTHMSTTVLDSLQFPYPPPELQTQFAATIHRIESLKTKYQASLQELENLYGSLSQRAFRGELDLSKLEIIEETIAAGQAQPAEVPPAPSVDIQPKSPPRQQGKLTVQDYEHDEFAALVQQRFWNLDFNFGHVLEFFKGIAISPNLYTSQEQKEKGIEHPDLKDRLFEWLSATSPHLRLEQFYHNESEKPFSLRLDQTLEPDYPKKPGANGHYQREDARWTGIYYRILP